MARSINNPIMQGATGRVGKTSFRRTVFGTVIANMQDYEHKKEPTPDQVAFRQRFKKATAYIKARMKEPQFKDRYAALAKPGVSAYTTAFADFMSPPKILSIDVNGYAGATGNKIIIDATDNFAIKTVEVSITDASGAVIETGLAVFANPDPDWVYVATKPNGITKGSKIMVRATDYSGAVSTEEVVLN